MTMTLLASGRRSKKPKKGALVSLLIHGALLTAAATGTAHVAAQPDKPKEEQLVYVEPPPPPPPEPTKVYVAPKKAPPKPAVKRPTPPRPKVQPPPQAPKAAAPAPAAPRAPANAPVLAVPTSVPTEIPKVNLGGIPTVSDVVARAGDEVGPPAAAKSGGNGDGSGEKAERVETEDTGGIFNEATVDVEVSPLNGGPSPNYPSRLRQSGVEGTVVATFVVDANGRVEGGSIKILDSPHDAFSDEVKRALKSARFRPAQARGTKVRQLVQQSFVFRLDR